MKRLFIFLLCFASSFWLNGQTTMVANPSYITGDGSGVQSWADGVTIKTYNLDGSSSRLIYDTQFSDKGFGVNGARWNQIDFYEIVDGVERNQSEKFEIIFNGPVNDVILTVGMMGLNEGRNGFDETGKWSGFDASGNEVANGLLGPELSLLGADVKYNGTYGKYPIALTSAVPMHSVVIEATGFGHGQGQPRGASYGENNSDFNIMELSYNRATGSANNPPIAVDDDFFEIREDIGPTGIEYSTFLRNDSDPDGDAIRILDFDFSGFPGVIENRPADEDILFTTEENFSGQINFTYRITDGTAISEATITLTILALLDDPVIGQDGPFSTGVDEPLVISIASLLANDFDPDEGDVVNFQSVSNPVNGTVEQVNGDVIFTPTPGFEGQGSFVYTIVSGTNFPATATSDPITVDISTVIAPPSINGTFVLVPASLDNVTLQVNGTGNRTSAVVEVCDERQNWIISDRGDGFHKIINEAAGRALESYQSTPVNGGNVTIYDDNNKDWQKWEIIDNGDGYYKIKGKYNPRFVTLSNGNAIVANENGSGEQLWKFAEPAVISCDQNSSPIAESDGGNGEFETTVGDTLFIPFSTLLANDSDPDGDILTITEVSEDRLGDAVIVGEQVRFIATGRGLALFQYTITDGNGGFASAVVLVNNFEPVDNLAPVAVDDDFFEIREDIGLTGIAYSTFLSNDSDPDGDPIRITGFDFTGFPGTINDLPNDEEILFITEENFSGQINFTYTITDGQLTDEATVTLTILALLDDPVIVQDGPFTTNVNESLSIPTTDLIANDFDPDQGDVVSFTSASNPVNGSVVVQSGNVIFTPTQDFIGEASFQYTITSGGPSFPRSVTSDPIIVNVEESTVPPSINGSFVLVSKANENITLQVNGTGNRTSAIVEKCDATGQVWTISDLGNSFHKIINDYADKSLEAWRPAPANGDDVTIYSSNNLDWQQWEIIDAGNGYFQIKGKYNQRFMTLNNGNAIMTDADGSDSQLWALRDPSTVNCNSNNAPIAVDDNPFGNIQSGRTGFTFGSNSILSNDSDPDGDPLTIISVGDFEHVTVEITSQQVLTLSTEADYSGEARFTYTISDGNGGTAQATVVFTITNRAPVARNDSGFTIFDGGPIYIDFEELLANDSDPDGDSLIFYEVTDPQNGQVGILGQQVIFIPFGLGAATFAYSITDGTGRFATATVIINVIPSPREPVAVDDGPYTVTVNSGAFTVSFDELLSNDFDPNGDEIVFTGVSAARPLGSASAGSGGGNVIITPAQDYLGSIEVDYSISDDEGLRGQATITLNVIENSSTSQTVSLTTSRLNLDGTSASQNWSDCVTIQGLNDSGSPIALERNGDRVGPSAGRYDYQVDYNATTNTSEKIMIDFNRPVDEISLSLGNLEVAEYQGLNETGYWIAYDAQLNPVSNGLIGPELGVATGSGTYSFNLNLDGFASILEIGATAYAHGQGTDRVNNNSDFSLIDLSFTTNVSGCATGTANTRKSTNATTAILTDTFDLSVYPNPAEEEVVINISGISKGEILIYNNIGTMVKSIRLENNNDQALKVNISEFESGFYFIQLHSNNLQKTIRFMKN